MRIQGVGSIGFSSSYRISSVHGNPQSLQAIDKIGQNTKQSNKALVIAQKNDQSEYVKDFGELAPTTRTSFDSFTEILDMQKNAPKNETSQSSSYVDYLNDTIGMMGMNSRLRTELLNMNYAS